MTYNDAYTKGLIRYQKKLKVYRQPKFAFLKSYVFGAKNGVSTRLEYVASRFTVRGQEVLSDTRRGDSAKVLNQDFSYRNRAYHAPYFFYQDQISSPDRDTLLPMEDPAKPWSDEMRLLYKLNEKSNQIEDNLDITEEKMCADILTTGMISPTVSEYGDIEFLKAGDADFPVTDNIFSEETANYWDADGVSIYDRLDELAYNEYQRRGIMPTTLIVSTTIAKLIMNDDYIKELLNNRRMMVGNITPKKIAKEGYVVIGHLFLPCGADLEIISYNGFTKTSGVATPILPTNKIILTRPNIGSMNYCGVENEKGARIAAKRYRTVHGNNDIPAKKEVKIQSAPLPMPEELDGWATVQVLA